MYERRMGWDMAIWGSLKMDAAALSSWRATVVDGRGWRDWKAWFRRAPAGEPRTVEEMLASWSKRSARGGELLEVKPEEGSVEIVGLISKDVFIEEARDVASLFRCAEKAGATGAITFAGVGLEEAYRLELKTGGSRLQVLDEDLEASPEVQRICRLALERAEAAKAARRGKKKGADTRPAAGAPARRGAAPAVEGPEVPPEVAAALEEVHARLASADDAALVEAAAQVEVEIVDGERGRRLGKLHRGAAAIREGLRPAGGQDPDAFGSRQQAAMELLARLDLAAAEPLLRRLAGPSTPLALRWRAVAALSGARSDETAAVLLEAFDAPAGTVPKRAVGYDSPLRRAAARSLVATGREDVFARVLERLTDDACKLKAGPTGDHLVPEKKWYEKHDYIGGITYVLGHARYRPAWDRLAKLRHEHPITSVRLLAIEALVRMAEPSEIQGALGETPEAFRARAFMGDAFVAAKPEEVGRKLVAYVKKQSRSS